MSIAPKVCPRCKTPVEATQRFCKACGAPLTEAAAAVGVPSPSSKAPKKRRGCGCCGGCLGTLLFLLLLIGGGAGAAAYYVMAPDLPPLGNLLPTWDDLLERLPLPRPAYVPPPPLPPEVERRLEEMRAQLEPIPHRREREAQALEQLQATGLPVTGVYILETGQGEPVLTVAVSFEKMARGFTTSGGLTEAVVALDRIVGTKALDLSGLAYTTVALRDEQGRTLFGVTAATRDIERFRAGQMTRREFIAATAARAESRLGVMEALGKVVQP